MARICPPSAVAAALIMCTVALVLSYVQADCGGFADSCTGARVDSSGYLLATCGDGRGGYTRASLNLNAHIGNNNGNLVDGAAFTNSCNNIRWYEIGTGNQGVQGECYHVDGTLGGTTDYNVQRRVANYGGTLVWNNCKRRSLLEHVSTQDSETIGELSARKMLKKVFEQVRLGNSNVWSSCHNANKPDLD